MSLSLKKRLRKIFSQLDTSENAERIDRWITIAQKDFVRSDRAIWLIRNVKRVMLSELGDRGTSKQQKRWCRVFDARSYPLEPVAAARHATDPKLINECKRAFKMGIADINDYHFCRQSAAQITEFLRFSHAEYQKALQGKLDDGPEIGEKLLTGDKGAWYQIPPNSVNEEIRMLRVNGFSVKDHHQIMLSYRVPTKDGRMRPVLAVALDRETGEVGEIKGRYNRKPDSIHHPAIVQLLRSNLVSSLVGGGHQPAYNFTVSDLETNEQLKLLKEKAALFTLKEIYNLNNQQITEPLLSQFKTLFNRVNFGEQFSLTGDGITCQFDCFDDFLPFLGLSPVSELKNDPPWRQAFDARYIPRYFSPERLAQLAERDPAIASCLYPLIAKNSDHPLTSQSFKKVVGRDPERLAPVQAIAKQIMSHEFERRYYVEAARLFDLFNQTLSLPKSQAPHFNKPLKFTIPTENYIQSIFLQLPATTFSQSLNSRTIEAITQDWALFNVGIESIPSRQLILNPSNSVIRQAFINSPLANQDIEYRLGEQASFRYSNKNGTTHCLLPREHQGHSMRAIIKTVKAVEQSRHPRHDAFGAAGSLGWVCVNDDATAFATVAGARALDALKTQQYHAQADSSFAP